MGDAISSFEKKVLQPLLMPPPAPKSSLLAPDNCMLLLSDIQLDVPDLKEALEFFEYVLGCQRMTCEKEGLAVLAVGQTTFTLCETTGCKGWPGHFYLWVADLGLTLTKCREFESTHGKSLVLDSQHTGNVVKALVLQDPWENYCFSLNQVPQSLRDRMTPAGDVGNAISLVEARLLVSKGWASRAAKFYSESMGVAIDKSEGECKVLFSRGDDLIQSLTFEDCEDIDAKDDYVARVCVYMDSVERFSKLAAKFANSIAPPAHESSRDSQNSAPSLSSAVLEPSLNTENVNGVALDKLEFHIPDIAIIESAIIESAQGNLRSLNLQSAEAGEAQSLNLLRGQRFRSPTHPACPVKGIEADATNPDATKRTITFEELGKHTEKDDVWICLNGKVLDVTKWVKYHPGGEMAIMTRAGTDVSSEWNTLHAKGTLERAMQKSVGPKLQGMISEASIGA